MSPEFIHGALFGMALLLIASNVFFWIRLHNVLEQLFDQKRQNSYDRIRAKTKVLSDSELDSLLGKDMAGPTSISKKD